MEIPIIKTPWVDSILQKGRGKMEFIDSNDYLPSIRFMRLVNQIELKPAMEYFTAIRKTLGLKA